MRRPGALSGVRGRGITHLESPGMAERPKERTPRELGRRLRARMPFSPLPSHWNERAKIGVLVGIVVLLAGGAVASILLQGGDDDNAATPELEAPAPIRKAIAAMSLAQKADGVVISGFEGAEGGARLAGGAQLGGLLVGPEDWFGAGKGKAQNARLTQAGSTGGRIPPLIVGRQEGGVFRSYPDLPPALGQRDVAATGDPAQAKTWAEKAGAAMAGAGFDLNLAPVADVATFASPLSDRSFGDDPQLVTAMTGSAVRGCAATELACATPYFPGLGSAPQSTAEGPATISLDAASLKTRDLAPFRAAIKGGVPAVVLSLGLYSAYDPVTPGALSPSVAGTLLRSDLGFRGVAISDDLTAGSAATGVPAPRAAVRALTAGADMALVSNQKQATEARAAILRAARAGSIPESRLDGALARVLTLKRKLGLQGL